MRHHDWSLCAQKQPETAALTAAIKKSDPMGRQHVTGYYRFNMQFDPCLYR